MDLLEHATRLLARTEKELVDLIEKALEQRNYELVQRLSPVLQSVARQRQASQFPENEKKIENVASSPATPILLQSIAHAPPLSRHEPPDVKDYPIFYRDQNQIVKIGYSKSDRRTYEHRSPIEVLDRLAELLADLGKNGQLFTTDSLLPAVQPRMADIPAYQIYLCLALLVRNSLVHRHGRAGYALNPTHAKAFPHAVTHLHTHLPPRPRPTGN